MQRSTFPLLYGGRVQVNLPTLNTHGFGSEPRATKVTANRDGHFLCLHYFNWKIFTFTFPFVL